MSKTVNLDRTDDFRDEAAVADYEVEHECTDIGDSMRTTDWIRELNSPEVSPAHQREATARHTALHSVPRVTLPKFSGDPLQWPK